MTDENGSHVDHEKHKDLIKKAVAELLDERSRVDAKTHACHHNFVAERIEQRKRQRETWEKVKQQVLGWAFIAIIVAFFAVVGDGIKAKLAKFMGAQ